MNEFQNASPLINPNEKRVKKLCFGFIPLMFVIGWTIFSVLSQILNILSVMRFSRPYGVSFLATYISNTAFSVAFTIILLIVFALIILKSTSIALPICIGIYAALLPIKAIADLLISETEVSHGAERVLDTGDYLLLSIPTDILPFISMVVFAVFLFLLLKGKAKKLWFLPAISEALTSIIALIGLIASRVISYQAIWGNDSEMYEVLLPNIISQIISSALVDIPFAVFALLVCKWAADPYKTVVTAPPRPVMPVQPVYAPPVQPVYAPPTQPVYAPPTQPVYAPPTQPVYAPPTQPVYAPPTQPVQTVQTVQPVQTEENKTDTAD